MSSQRPFRRTALSIALTAAAVTTAFLAPVTAGAATPVPKVPKWADVGASAIHPGIVTVTKDASCTSNFIFLDAQKHAYIGQAAHCSGKGGANETNGCTSHSYPLGTDVSLGASQVVGKLVYNSWLMMAKLGEKGENPCADNDFALIRIPDAALGKVNPSIPIFGGPVGLRTTPLGSGEAVLSYGNSPLRGGVSYLSPKQGVNLGEDADGWEHTVYTASPGVPGDSGSGFIDAQGNAFGILSTLALAPLPGSNGVADLAHCLKYAQEHSGIAGLELALGTQTFSPGAVPVLSGFTGGASGPKDLTP
ncbi:MAG TPA: serine protease [Sporichthyaceae bacterium]|nr:serine protease [Sporichthyaceae bacterium]